MSARIVALGFALGVLIMAVGVFGTPLIDAAESDAEVYVSLSDGEDTDVTETLNIGTTVNSSTHNATVTATNTRTYQNDSVTLSEGDSANLSVGGERVAVDYQRYTGDAVLRLEYDPTFGWDRGPKLLIDNLGLLLALVGAVTVMLSVLAGVSRT